LLHIGHASEGRLISRTAWSKVDAWTLALLLAALSLTWLPRLRGPIDLRWDAAAYYILGTSLAQGHGYRFSNEPANLRAIVWPPALPAFISAHELILGTADPIVVGRWLRRSFLLLWIVYIAGSYVLLRRFEDRMLAAVGTILVGLHMSTIWLSDRSYADLPFALTVVAFVLATARPRCGTNNNLVAWLAATTAYLLRTAGIALLVAWIADAMLAKHWKHASARLAMALLPIVAWQGWVAYVERTTAVEEPSYAYARADYALYNVSYARNMMLRDPNDPSLGRATGAELVGRSLRNLATAPMHFGEAVSLLERDWATILLTIKQQPRLAKVVPWRIIPLSLGFWGACVVAGVVVYAVRGPRIIAVILAAYTLLLALLPTDYHWPRYLAGMAPVVLLCFIAALRTAGNYAQHLVPSHSLRTFARRIPLLAAVPVLVLQIVCASWYFGNDLRPVQHFWNGAELRYQLFTYDEAFRSFDAALEWLTAHASPHDIVISSMPHWVSLRTHLLSVMPPFEADPERGRNLLHSVGPRFVVIDQSGFSPTQKYATPVVMRYPSEWTLSYRDDKGLVAIYEAKPR
jgi:hypothetical protein